MDPFDASDCEDNLPSSICFADVSCIADSRETLEKLLEDESQDHRLRCAAARRLGDIGSRESTQVLCRALKDRYPLVRHSAIEALGKIGGMDACDAFSDLLESESLCVRSMTAKSLVKISGIPDPRERNLEHLMKLICSGDVRVKEAVLQIGSPALSLLVERLNGESFSACQEAAATLVLHIRRLIDQTPQGENLFSGLKEQGFSAKSIADLYRLRVTRIDEAVDKVENSGFDTISKTLCGDGLLLRLSGLPEISSGTLDQPAPEIRPIDWENLIAEHGAGDLKRMGRTLVASADSGCLAIKLCTSDGDREKLLAESQMQKILPRFGLSSRLPRSLGGLFRVQNLPPWIQRDLKLSEPLAICYIADSDYFRYIGDPSLPIYETKTALGSCAEDLGRLARSGLIHTSLIPLFHNRGRAVGDGAYRWNRKIAGRLDNWLESCTYPNLRFSGIADLEHIEIHSEIPAWRLQSHAGEHLLSISLVLGSYFLRRERFDKTALSSILKDCFQRYCCAMTGSENENQFPKGLLDCIDWNELAGRMAREMAGHGKDCSNAQTGPHLGRFNGPFPIPELIRAIHITTLFAVLELQALNRC